MSQGCTRKRLNSNSNSRRNGRSVYPPPRIFLPRQTGVGLEGVRRVPEQGFPDPSLFSPLVSIFFPSKPVSPRCPLERTVMDHSTLHKPKPPPPGQPGTGHLLHRDAGLLRHRILRPHLRDKCAAGLQFSTLPRLLFFSITTSTK